MLAAATAAARLFVAFKARDLLRAQRGGVRGAGALARRAQLRL
jgi:hypothetical protein